MSPVKPALVPQATNGASVPYLTVKVDECIAAAAADSSVLSCRWTVFSRWHWGHNGSQRDPQAAGGVALIEHLLAQIGLKLPLASILGECHHYVSYTFQNHRCTGNFFLHNSTSDMQQVEGLMDPPWSSSW